MKKGLKILGIYIVLILLTGCMDINVKMQVNKDKSLDLKMGYEINMLEMMNRTATDKTFYNNIKDSISKNICSSLCAEDDECINECLSSNNNNSEEQMPTEAEIKEYLKEYVNSEEFSTENFFDVEQKRKLENQGYQVIENMDKENFIYSIQISKKIANIDSVTSENETELKIGDLFNGEDVSNFFTKKDSNIYKANFKWDDKDFSTDTDNFNVDMSKYFKFNYEVTLPSKSISNNASNVSNDGKTLTWDISTVKSNNINYEFTFETVKEDKINGNKNNNDYLGLGLVVGGAAVIVITTIVYFTLKKKQISE